MEKPIYKIFNETDGRQYLVRAVSGGEACRKLVSSGKAKNSDTLTEYLEMYEWQDIVAQ